MFTRFHNFLVFRKGDRSRIGRVEMYVNETLVRVRWRGGTVEDRVPVKDLEFVQRYRMIIDDDDAS
jgi:hypothetical protein